MRVVHERRSRLEMPGGARSAADRHSSGAGSASQSRSAADSKVPLAASVNCGGPSVGGAVVADLGDAGRNRGDPGLHPPAASRPPGESFDVVQVEEASARVGGRVRLEHAPAHVCVEGRELHTEPPGRLFALEHPCHRRRLAATTLTGSTFTIKLGVVMMSS